MYEVRNIAFSYGSRRVLRDVSFVVSPGETVAIVGANGAGKTTLLRTLVGLVMPESGQLLVDGQDVSDNSERYRRQLGYLPERVSLYDEMRVADYLKFRAALKGENSRRLRRRVEEALEMCQLRELSLERIGRLSYGCRKRVALADAIILRPRVLVLDDLLSGLDTSLRAATGEIIREAASFSSVIVTGHEIADLADWATTFLVLSEGVISSVIPTAGVDRAELIERVRAALEEGGGR